MHFYKNIFKFEKKLGLKKFKDNGRTANDLEFKKNLKITKEPYAILKDNGRRTV